MRVVDLCGTWRFRPEGGDEGAIDVPGFWEAQGFLTLDGRAIYEREFDVPDTPGFATVEFGAVADLCDVWVNGEHAGRHEIGFTPFALDVSLLLRTDENVLRVDVEDPPVGSREHLHTVQGKQGWGNRVFPSPPSVYLTYGGIWQPCRLVLHGPLYIADLACDMDPDAPEVTVEVHNRAATDVEGIVRVRGFGSEERRRVALLPGARAEVAARFRGDGVTRWTPGQPALHEIVATTEDPHGGEWHRRMIRTGLRRVERAGDDILVCGRPYRMRSALHQGFWPRGLYAADPELVERDLELALDAGLNTLRTHLKVFEPDWLDAADRAGILLHCDTPIGEPLDDDAVAPDTDFGRRCVQAVREQVLRDRSRPAIVAWTLSNEVGLGREELLRRQGYRALVQEMAAVVGRLDGRRPVIENDWVWRRAELGASDVRSPHWYGRTNRRFCARLDGLLDEAESEPGPLYVTEFGEWGLPGPQDAGAFWDQDSELEALVAEAGWTGSYAEFVAQTQDAQGWADRIQAERFRTSAAVLGFCLTEWTDVPRELNGLVSIHRTPKRGAIEGYRPALADVAPIAVLERFAYTRGEDVDVRAYVSNWSAERVDRGEVVVRSGGASRTLEMPAVVPGGVGHAGDCVVPASEELVVEAAGARSVYRLHVCEAPRPRAVTALRHEALGAALATAGWDTSGGVVVAAGSLPPDARRPAVLLDAEATPDGWPDAEPVPSRWGPTPFPFTTGGLTSLPERSVLASEVFACYPRRYLPAAAGPLRLVVPPPPGRYGALVAARDGLAVCTLDLVEGIVRGDEFSLALLADLVDLAAGA